MRNWSLVLCACALTITAAGCGDPDPVDDVDSGTTPSDSGVPTDSSTPPVDSSTPPVDSSTPPADSGMTDAGTPDSGMAGGATFTEVYAILSAKCVSCHAGGAGGLSFNSAASAYTALVGPNRATGTGPCTPAEAPVERVTPGDPAASFLFIKVTTDPLPAGCGDRMPRFMMALEATEIETIRSWIEAGAMND